MNGRSDSEIISGLAVAICISHSEEGMDDFHIRDLEMIPKGQSKSKVKVYFY